MKSLLNLLSLLVILNLSSTAMAAKPNLEAPQGGVFNFNLGGEPPTLHPIMATDMYASAVQAYVMDSLLTRDAETYDWKPRVAESWEISKDNKVYTFKLRKNAVFHDGKPVTAEDVKFSFDAIFDAKYQAAHLIPYYEGIAKVEVIDQYTVKATARDNYFKNFDSIAGITIMPKHIYADVEKSKKMTRQLIGCGPYSLEKFDRGQMIVAKRFDKWYGNNDPAWKGTYNFANINFRFYKDENIQIERLKKGDLDFLDWRNPEAYMKKAVGPEWGTSVLKFKVENASPKSYGYVGWNMRNELFQDKNVRVALAHLMNRAEMNKKFRYEMSEPAAGAIYNKSEYAPDGVKPFGFDVKKAQELLTKAGWTDSNKDGVLDKTVNGKLVNFSFSLIHANKDNEKYWTLYKEDLKKAGISMEIKYMEWNSFLKILDDGKFEAVALAWGGGSIEPDPKQIWHSSSAKPGGSNYVGYNNPEVDKLIDEARVNPDKKKRQAMLKLVYKKIAEDAPYAFMFNDKYSFYATTARLKKPAETFKYEVGLDYWWLQK